MTKFKKSITEKEIMDENVVIRSPFQQAMIRFRKNKLAMVGSIIITMLILFVAIGPFFSKFDPNKVDLFNVFLKPSSNQILGTDELGRDIFTRLMHGGRVSLAIGVISALIAISLGTLIGSLSGYYGGIIDTILMRFTDLILTIPSLPLLMILGGIFKPNPVLLVFMISILNWMATARLVRSKFLTLRTLDYVKAARAIGCKNGRIIFSHLLPNSLGPIIVTATLTVGRAIISESTLSFLGVGINPPTASWGNMLQSAQSNMTTAPWMAIAPGLMILTTVLAINFLGDGLNDAFDPKRNV